MNSHSLLQAAKTLLENQITLSGNSSQAALWSLAFAYSDLETASLFLRKALEQPTTSFPLQGVALDHIYQHATDKKKAKAIVTAHYEEIVQQHRLWYEQNDPQEEGLPYIVLENRQVQDPLFLALLVWSNESLIQIGQVLHEDVLEVIQWNELTIYSMNEQLWHAEKHYYQPFDLEAGTYLEATFHQCFAPMVGEIPTQDRAEQLFPVIQRLFKKIERLNVFDLWLLRRSLLRYDFVEMAALVRRQMLQCINEFGFYENFDPHSGEPLPAEQGQSTLTAALTIDLLKRC